MSFFYMTNKSRQKFKYLENEKRFYAEVKSIFGHFSRTFIEANKTIFFGRQESNFHKTGILNSFY